MGCREVIKYGVLQQKVLKKTSTLRRKKKFIYQDALWVALCVHDSKIPFLEWYHTEESIRSHEPFKVLDLLSANYITNVINDNRCFVIGFKTGDIEPIELTALDHEFLFIRHMHNQLIAEFGQNPLYNRQRQEWVSFVHETLLRLDILSNDSNVYDHCLRKSLSPPPPNNNCLDSAIPISADLRTGSPALSDQDYETIGSGDHCVLRMEEREVSEGSQTTIRRAPSSSPRAAPSSPPVVSIRPPLPPRKADSVANLATQNRHLKNGFQDGVYDLPRATGAMSLYDSLSPMSTPNVSTSPMTSTMSTTSLCSSSNDSRASSDSRPERHTDFRLSSIIPAPSMEFLDDNQYSQIRRGSTHPEARGYSQPLRTIRLSLSVLIEDLLFVEVGGRVWIAGWNENHDRQLSCLFRVGDELVEVEDHPVNGMHNIPQLFYTTSTIGTLVSLHIRAIPNAVTYKLIKPINPSKPLGIVLHKMKNRIEEIIEDTPAFRRHVPNSLPSFFHPEQKSPAVITEVNNKRLNPFAKNEQPLQRVSTLRDGQEFSVTLQPHDFMKEMKNQMRMGKHWKVFTCQ